MGTSLFKDAGVVSIASHTMGLTSQVTLGGSSLANVICQNIQATVTANIQTLYEVGSRNAHRVIGRTTGQGTLSNVIGPTAQSLSVMKQICDVCSQKDLQISFPNKCKGSSPSPLIFKDATCISITCTVDAQNDLINGQWSVIFSDVQN